MKIAKFNLIVDESDGMCTVTIEADNISVAFRDCFVNGLKELFPEEIKAGISIIDTGFYFRFETFQVEMVKDMHRMIAATGVDVTCNPN